LLEAALEVNKEGTFSYLDRVLTSPELKDLPKTRE
jgi:hypothetical protein